ncbi:MAG: hypothetical protein WCK34_09275, partial [Bacteroidota bacterium]
SPAFSYTPANGDIVTCQLTSSLLCPTGNPANSVPITITVNANLPAGISISSSSNPACIGDGVTFTAIPYNGGSSPTFVWKVNGIVSGTNAPLFSYIPASGDQVVCILESSELCTTGNPATSNTITMTVSPNLPVSLTIAGSANPSCLGEPVAYTATPANGGFNPIYNWKINGVSQGINSPTFTFTPVNGNELSCKLTSNAGCTTGNPAISNLVNLVVNPYAPVSVTLSASANPVCNGNSVTFTAIPNNGGPAPLYEWKVNGMTVSGNNPIFTYIPTAGDIVNCQLISNAICTTGNPANSNSITMTVSSTVVPAVSISASGNPVCQGSQVSFIAVPVNGGTTPFYQWKVNGMNAGGNSVNFSFFPNNLDVVTCQMTSNSLCASGSIAVSNAISMTVSPVQPVSVSVSALINPVCAGSLANFTAVPVNGGTIPSFQWQVNGVNAGTNSTAFAYLPGNNDLVTCILNSNGTCTTGNPAASNTVTMSVSLNLPVSVEISASTNPVCLGHAVTYTAIPANGGSLPVYLWQVNGVNMGSGPTFSYTPGNGDHIRCFLTSSNSCATGSPATSNVITMIVNVMQVVSVSIVSSANPSCQGSPVTYTATPVNGGLLPVFHWKVNGTDVGGNTDTYTNIPVSGDLITCQLTSSASCPVTNPVMSNTINLTVNPIVPAAISILPSGNPVCTGTQVTFTATPSNGGSAPGYLWKVNGAPSGANNQILTFIPLNGDIVICQLTSNLACVTGNPVTSDPVTMMSSTPLPGTITIFATANPFCQGASVTFTSSINNGGALPVFHWKVNGIDQGTSSPIFNYFPSNGDFVTCQLVPSLSCTTGPVTSNPIYMAMSTTVLAGVTVNAALNPVCTGNPVTLTATPVNGGTAPIYQWKVNGQPYGTSNPVYSYIPANGDIVTCTVTSNAPCASGSPFTSLPFTVGVTSGMAVNVYITTLTNPFCPGTPVTFNATPANGGSSPSYQWRVNGSNQGTNSPVYTYSPNNGDIITCELNSNSTCISGINPVVSNQVTIIASASIPASVSISASANPSCQGMTVIYTAIPTNGGALPAYQWKVNGLNKGTNNRSFSYIPANGDIISCVLTSSLICATGSPAVSNLITMAVSSTVIPSISISPSLNPACQGTTVNFTATTTNGGASPVFHWRVNGVLTGGSSATFSYNPLNSDAITCQITSDAYCNSGIPVISNQVVMVMTTEQPVGVVINPTQNPFCLGSAVTFTAIPSNGGTAPVYEWHVNGSGAGTNSSNYTYNPGNGDLVTCLVTSNRTCISNNPALSNVVTMVADEGMPVGVTISASLNPICQGTLVTYSAMPAYGGSTPVYHWKANGLAVGSNLSYLYFYPVQGDVITCDLTSSLTCVSGNPATSNAITMNVIPGAPVSVNVTASTNPSCLGNAICYTADVTNGGTSPIYRWKVNGISRGTNSPAFCYVPVNGDVISCRVTSNEICATNNPCSSNNITMVVIASGPASVSINASANPVCAGTLVTFTAFPFNGGASPAYQWKINGINAGTNSVSFSFIPSNGDAVTCQMTSNALCVTSSLVTSNAIAMTVSPYLPVSVSIVSSANPACQGSMTTYTAIPVNGGISPVYHWTVNGVPSGSNSPAYIYPPLEGDVIACQLISNAACTIGNPSSSAPVTMTVVPSLPVGISITGSASPACQGQTVTYTAAAVNGGANPAYQWLVNGMNVGTNSTYSYNPTSGDAIICQLVSSIVCVTGNPALSNQLNINYSSFLPVSVSVTCSANPTCLGTPVTYTANPVNGGAAPTFQWSVNGVHKGTNMGSYTCLPANGDVVTCELTSDIPCPISNPVLSNTINMAVLVPQATGISISPSINPVCGGSPVTFTAFPTNGGSSPVYQWLLNGVPAGSNLPTFTFLPVNGDIVSCELSSSVTCVINSTVTAAPVTMVVGSDFPASVSVDVVSNPACQGQLVTLTATPVNGGTDPVYVWRNNGIVVGSNSPAYTYSPTTGDVIFCQMFSSFSCASGSPASSNQITMSVVPNLPVSVSVTSSFNPACTGVPVTFTAVGGNGGSSPAYQWLVNGLNAGSNLPTFTYAPVNGDLVSCRLTSNGNCVSGNPAFSNQISMIIGSSFPVTISIVASDNPICQTTPVTFTATSSFGGPSPVYQWKKNNVIVGTNSTTYACFPLNGDVITCTLTSQLTCAAINPVTSNAITIIVLPVPVGVTIEANPAVTVCAGTPVTFISYPVNGGPIPTFQWKVNGIPAGPNFISFTYQPQDGDVVTCTLTSNATCAAGNTVTSNSITTSVHPGMPVSIFISSGAGTNVCAGIPVTYQATAFNEGTLPVFQWKVNGIAAGTNTPSHTYLPADGDVITCQLTSNETCATGNPAISNGITMTVNPILPVTISISGIPSGAVCAGTPVTYKAVSVNGGAAPAYQWKVNGKDTGPPGSTFTYVPVDGDIVACEVMSNATCPAGNPAASNSITTTVNPNLQVGVSVTAMPAGSICAGTTVSFTATAINGGSLPVYQWKVNGVNSGSNDPVFIYIPSDNDVITCQVMSGIACSAGNPATSAAIVISVIPNLAVSLSIGANPGNNVCAGALVIFTANPVNGGLSPSYSWKVNGLAAGSNSSIFSYFPVNGDIISCELSSEASCPTGNPALSNSIFMTVHPNLPVSVSVSSSPAGIVCHGTSVTYSAAVVNGGSAPVYQWKVNGFNFGTNSPAYTFIPENGDNIVCEFASNAVCATGNPSLSNVVTMEVSAIVPVSVVITPNVLPVVCAGTTVSLTATGTNGGASPSFQWKLNGITTGLNNPVYSYIPQQGDNVSCILTSANTCVSGNPAISNNISFTVSPLLPASVTILDTPPGPVCSGNPVTFAAAPVNGGTSTAYQWKVNGLPRGTNSPLFSFSPANGDQITCEMTSDATCATGSPALSNTITKAVNPSFPVNVAITVNPSNQVCPGTPVIFTAVGTNGGALPVYSWRVNG